VSENPESPQAIFRPSQKEQQCPSPFVLLGRTPCAGAQELHILIADGLLLNLLRVGRELQVRQVRAFPWGALSPTNYDYSGGMAGSI
jgi:hypothetical protein